MIPKLEFTAESWPEEYREEAIKTLDRHYILNGNENIERYTKIYKSEN